MDNAQNQFSEIWTKLSLEACKKELGESYIDIGRDLMTPGIHSYCASSMGYKEASTVKS